MSKFEGRRLKKTTNARRARTQQVVFIPSVSGGLGHVTRTLHLARALQRENPKLRVKYVLDQERLRPSNLAFVESTGYPVEVLPIRTRDARDLIVQAMLGDADLIVEDTQRHLIPLRRVIDADWVSMPMYSLWDELFMDWPLLTQTDRILWTYPKAMKFPVELEPLGAKVAVTGPILGQSGTPNRPRARQQLGFEKDEVVIAYAPRGMPFGRDFGERLLVGLVNGVLALRKKYPTCKLVLVGVRDANELVFPGMPKSMARMPGIEIRGVLSAKEMRQLYAAADIVVGEGTSTTFETIAAGTPLLMVPGTIYETWLIGTQLYERNAAGILWTERVTPKSMREHLERILENPDETRQRVKRAKEFLGTDGTPAATAILLELLEKRR